VSAASWASIASVGLHLAIAACVWAMPDPRHRKAPRTVPITVSTAPEKAPAPAPPPPEPVRVPPVLRKPAEPRPIAVRRRIEMPPPQFPPAAAPPTPRPGAPPSAPVFGVSMESVTEGASSVAADVGNTLAAEPSTARKTPGPPVPVSAAPAPPEIVPPKVLRSVQAPYPRAALEAGVSGKVLLLVRVDEQGRVTGARVIRGLGHGLDEAALEAVKQFTFSPGTTDGRKGAMEIRYTYTFVLDD
jgi:protein TonB